MKKIYLAAIAAVSVIPFISKAQNSNPWPTSGNVGIGTTTPGDLLQVNNGATMRFQVGATKGIWVNNEVNGGTPGATDALYLNYSSHGNVLLNSNGGNVGIGTTSPSYKLDINGSLHTAGATELGNGYFHASTDGSFDTRANYTFRDGVGINSPNGASFASGTSVMSVGSMSNGISVITTGKVGIGTTTPDELLSVLGKIHANEVKVDLSVPGPDYVFKPDYKLPSLVEVKTYVDKNHHLAEIPSADDMAKNGLNLGDMNTKLLKKVEELTLYLIEKDQQLKIQQERFDKLEKQVEKLTNKH